MDSFFRNCCFAFGLATLLCCNANAQTITADGVAISFDYISTDAEFLNGAGGSTVINIKASGKWSLTSDSEWLTVTPSSGKKGKQTITVTTTRNTTDKDRIGKITLTPGDELQSLSICQRPYIYERKQTIAGNVTNAVTLTYDGTQWDRIYTILPLPRSNLYQDIISVDTYNAVRYDCPDGLNSYLVTEYKGYNIRSGMTLIKEDINTIVYEVTAKLDLIDNIPPYDPKSEVCKKYLGKESGDLINPNHESVKAVSDYLWKESGGNIIDYARRCYEWTATNITYGKSGRGLLTINELIKAKEGDCGNYCSVFISLLRAKGIPARHIVMILPQEESDNHVCAEFYIPTYGWIPVDPTYKNGNPRGDYFGKFTGKTIVMTTGINLDVRGPDGYNEIVPILQTYHNWWWYNSEGNDINIKYTKSKFRE